MRTVVRCTLIATALALGAPAAPAEPAQDYPNRPVTLVVPYVPGGTTDAITRRIGLRLEQRLGKPFIVENRPGAGTVNAAAQVARAPADGYTLLLATSTTLAINVSVYKSLPYDPQRDFVPVAMLAGVPFMLTVNPALPVHSIADLVRVSKAAPQGLSYASTGHGSAAHLFTELLKTRTGLAAVHIPYKGNAPALNDVVAGHIQMMVADFNTSQQLVLGGRLRAIGVTTAARVPLAPDVPTFAEGGVPGYDASAWQMLVAPARTPDAIVARLNAEIGAILAEPDTAEDFKGRGLVSGTTPAPPALKAFIAAEIASWSEVVKKAGAAGIE